MQKFFICLSFLIILISTLNAQQDQPCGYELYHQHKLKTDNKYAKQFNTYDESRVRITAEDIIANKNATGSYQIPVVVHVISNPGNPSTNISDLQIQSQLDRLDIEFIDPVGGGAVMDIQFCLAANAPNNAPWEDFGGSSLFPGVTRAESATLSDHNETNASTLFNTYGFPAENYVNIYVVEDITLDGNSGVIGYSSFDGSLGAVMEYDAFGDEANCPGCYNLKPAYNRGRVLVHELGHFVSLMHPFGGLIYECQEDDMIDDTPLVYTPNWVCDPDRNSCNDGMPDPNDMVNNHMDYAPDFCRNAFTEGQRCAAHTFIVSNPILSSLISSDNLALTGCIDESFLADLLSDNGTQFCTEEEVVLVYTGTNEANIDSWEFTITNTITGNSQSLDGTGSPLPSNFTLTEEGPYTVQVTVTDNAYDPPTRTAVRSNYIHASACTPPSTCVGDWTLGKELGNTANTNPMIFDFQSGGLNITVEPDVFAADGRPNFTLGCTDDNFSYIASRHRIFNSQYQLMPGGFHSDLFSFAPGSIIGTPILINGEYYLFQTSGKRWASDGVSTERGLAYFRIDPTANNNLGQVLSPTNGDLPDQNFALASAVEAIPDCSGGYWIVVRAKGYEMNANYTPGTLPGIENTFLAYHLTSSGFDGVPVVSPVLDAPCNGTYSQLRTEVSPDGNFIAVMATGCNSCQVFNFNRSTGELTFRASTPVTTNASANFDHRLSFSPSGKYLYINDRTNSRLLQYDFDDVRTCGSFSPPKTISFGNAAFRFIQKAPNGKIYLWDYLGSNNRSITVINYPDEAITEDNPNAIGLNINAIPLPPNVAFNVMFPHYIEANATSPEMTVETCIIDCGTAEFYAYGCDTPVTWDFGDGNTSTDNPATHTYTLQPGANDFTITATGGTGTITQTSVSFSPPLVPNIFPDANLCDQLAITYSVEPYDDNLIYEWDINSNDVVSSGDGLGATEGITWNSADATGDITVKITNSETGCFSIATYTQLPCTPCTEPLDFSVSTTPDCEDDGTITVTMNNGSGNFAFLWSDNLPGSATQTDLSAGTYFFTITDVTTTCEIIGSATVNSGTNCGGNTCEIIGLQSPDAFCFEDDGTTASYYVNIHIPNWGGSGQPFDFSFCEDEVTTTGTLSDDLKVYNLGWAFEIEGFVYIESGQVNPEVCFQVPICLPDCSVCTGTFFFTFDECKEECEYTDEPVVEYTSLGVPSSPPCGAGTDVYYNVDVDWQINVGNNAPHNVQIWSELGPFCSSYNVNLTPINGILYVDYNTDWETYGHNHFCIKAKVKNLENYSSCIMKHCEEIAPDEITKECENDIVLRTNDTKSCKQLMLVSESEQVMGKDTRIEWLSPSELKGSSKHPIDISKYPDGTTYKAILYTKKDYCTKLLTYRTNCNKPADCLPKSELIYGNTNTNKLVISPNPFSDHVRISLSGAQEFRVSIVNIFGEVVTTTPLQKGNSVELNLQTMPAGVYYCFVYRDGIDEPLVKPIVKL